MTPAEHSQQLDAIRASLLLAPTTADRHGTYPVRPAPVVVVERPQP